MEKQSEKWRVTATVKEVKIHEVRTQKDPKVGYEITFLTPEGKEYSAFWPIFGVSESFQHDNIEQLRWLTVLILFDNDRIIFSNLAKLIGEEVSLLMTEMHGKNVIFAIGKNDESLYLIHSSFFHSLNKKATGVFFKDEEIEKFWMALHKKKEKQ